MTEEQLNGAALAFAWAAEQFDISPETLAGHRDESHDTSCPGASLYTHVTDGDLRQRVEGLVAAGPVDLGDNMWPGGLQIVADIEAGRRDCRRGQSIGLRLPRSVDLEGARVVAEDHLHLSLQRR